MDLKFVDFPTHETHKIQCPTNKNDFTVNKKTNHVFVVVVRLMRQAYLEVALVYLYSSGAASLKDGVGIDPAGSESVEDALKLSPSKTAKKKVTY